MSPKVKADLAATWPDLPTAGETEKSEKSIVFDVGDAMVTLTLMPGPIPWSDLEGPCQTSVLFPNAIEILKPHRAHLLIAILFKGQPTPVERSTLLTQVTASVLNVCEAALGVYWGNATMVIPKDLFREVAIESLPEPPGLIWIDFRVGPNEEGSTSGFTCGMKALGLMELETENATESPGELRERFEGLAWYLLENGLVVKDGHTIGEDANTRIRVDYTNSSFGHQSQVMRLDYSGTRKKKKGWFGRG